MSPDYIHRLRYIEAWADSGTIQMRSGIIFQENYEDWLVLKGAHNITLSTGHSLTPKEMILRLVTAHNPGHPYTPGCNKAVFDQLCENFNLHRTTEEAFINNNGAFLRDICRSNDFSGIESLDWFPDRDHTALVEHLRSIQDKRAFRNPLFLPVYLLRLHRKIVESYRHEVDESLLKIENRIGYAVPGLLYYRPVTEQLLSKSAERCGLQDDVRRLHASNTELGGLSMEAKYGRELGAFLKKTSVELNEWNILHGAKTFAKASEGLYHDIHLATNLYYTMEAQIAVLKERVSSHINLSFSIIAQEENKLSRDVAHNSKRDSAAMKTIALVTLLFLPPTFVATLFGMSMFDWNGEKPGTDPLSSYFWIYWVIAAPLTFAVWFVWRIWWRMEEKKYMAELQKPT
ncbi:hypothetical protein DM02DRAFT_726532 [Periconia macrospinosa]|uniref:Uncharacterized protein n=1 Tax=Periconia macrospinosa TaxID=97972 RepID=A0A2V1DY92_9PLEO|nr:hypothetical protein DM02DRAFT_726532 [Periconia macrospinosa]